MLLNMCQVQLKGWDGGHRQSDYCSKEDLNGMNFASS